MVDSQLYEHFKVNVRKKKSVFMFGVITGVGIQGLWMACYVSYPM